MKRKLENPARKGDPSNDDADAAKKPVKRIKFEKPTNRDKKAGSVAKKNGKEGHGACAEKIERTKREKKELREKRRAKKLADVYEPIVAAKSIGEKLRRADCGAEDRQKLTKKLYRTLQGHLRRAVLAHDASRVVQWLLTYADEETRRAVALELKPFYPEMFRTKYAKNCLKKALKHGDEETRKEIIDSCYGNVVKFVAHRVSCPVVDYAYENFATDLQKLRLRQEFYGNVYKGAKDDKIEKIADVWTRAGDMKSATLSAVKMNLLQILSKKIVDSPIVQSVLNDFLQVCSAEDRAEMIVTLRSSLYELSRTEIGTKIGIVCVRHGTNKDRKFCLKSLKDNAREVCKSVHGHRLLLTIFDCVDDTVLVKKLILSEITLDPTDILSNEYGRKILLYLTARRDPAYFHPIFVTDLEKGDADSTSKKSPEVRESELVRAIVDPLLESIADKVEIWLSKSSTAVVTLAVLKRGRGEKLEKALEAIAGFVRDDRSKIEEENGEARVPVEHSGLHAVLKKLIRNDKSLALENSSPTFGHILEKQIDRKTLEKWIAFNRGCFLLVALLENCPESVVSSLKKKIRSLAADLKSKNTPGAEVLLKKIS